MKKLHDIERCRDHGADAETCRCFSRPLDSVMVAFRGALCRVSLGLAVESVWRDDAPHSNHYSTFYSRRDLDDADMCVPLPQCEGHVSTNTLPTCLRRQHFFYVHHVRSRPVLMRGKINDNSSGL